MSPKSLKFSLRTERVSGAWRILGGGVLLHFSLRLFQVCVKQISSQVFLSRTHPILHVGKVVEGPFAVVSK